MMSAIISIISMHRFSLFKRSLDEVIDPDSANVIYDNAESDEKQIEWYEKSGHVITLGPEKEQLHEDIFEFLESLDWNV